MSGLCVCSTLRLLSTLPPGTGTVPASEPSGLSHGSHRRPAIRRDQTGRAGVDNAKNPHKTGLRSSFRDRPGPRFTGSNPVGATFPGTKNRVTTRFSYLRGRVLVTELSRTRGAAPRNAASRRVAAATCCSSATVKSVRHSSRRLSSLESALRHNTSTAVIIARSRESTSAMVRVYVRSRKPTC